MKKQILDGNTAVAKAGYKLSDISFIYPITPSSTMSEVCDEMASKGEKNIFGNTLCITEMQSEGGAAGALHGACLSGSLGVTFTSSQGLLLMLPNMYKIAGEMLPTVIHVASRSIATHALNIFCDHSDVMSARQTGFAMLCSSSIQEAHEFAVASHIASIKSRIPFLHFFDGFRTSHEIADVNIFEDDELKQLYPLEKLEKFKNIALSPNKPFQIGTNEGSDIFFQGREKSNTEYQKLPQILQQTFDDMKKISGTKHEIFEYYGDKDAEFVIVVMGSAYHTIKNYINETKSKKYGVVKVNLYRPFATELFLKKLPKSVKKIAVLDRTKEQGSVGEPLYLDVATTILQSNLNAKVFGGRYGLGGKEFDLACVKAVFDNLENLNSKTNFTVGIKDDVTNKSLELTKYTSAENSFNTIVWGMGSDGSVSLAKSITKIVGKLSDKSVQAYFMYDSKKSGGLTRSFLRFDENKIEKPYLVNSADFVVVNNVRYLTTFDFYSALKQNAKLLVNCKFKNVEELESYLPNATKKALADKNITLYLIDANKIAYQNNIKGKISAIMQLAYFEISNVVNFEKAKAETIQNIQTTLAKKGEEIIQNNINSLKNVKSNIIYISADKKWLECPKETDNEKSYESMILSLEGDNLPVSKVHEFGKTNLSTSKLEKRDISEQLPVWNNETCIQCGKCSMVCPHAVLRPKLLSDDQVANAPESLKTKKSLVDKQKNYIMEISPKDCTGCGLCENACPVKSKAIIMQDKQGVVDAELERYHFTQNIKTDCSALANLPITTQFLPPYFEFSGACAGCGETQYIRLLTQLFGNRLVMANATGCSSIYGASSPTCPYSTNDNEQGPAWANSLFEDNAEFGFGINKSLITKRQNFKHYVEQNLQNFDESLKNSLATWLKNFDDEKICNEIYFDLQNKTIADKFIFNNIDCITKKSVWIVGGDGWAYDIGYGGLDHVMASGENVNILILDTELYSNTGGQMSKSSPLGTVTKFCSDGKNTAKKQLALMAMTYKNVYVAQICMGADPNQAIKAFKEAEKHNGVSIIIAYSPCINHGIDMSKNVEHQIDAVKSGYWHLFRFNPELRNQNKSPLVIDIKKPEKSMSEYLQKERRFANYIQKHTDGDALKVLEQNSNDFYDLLVSLSKLENL